MQVSDYIEVVSPAKINLFLDVLGKREDDYHEVELIMQSINLNDLVRIAVNRSQSQDLSITSNKRDVPLGKKNLAYKAVEILAEGFSIPPLEVHIDKKIPVEAGLAGGSSNASAVLWGLNELFNLNLSIEKLCNIGVKLGADVPFCLKGGTMLARGIGEELVRLPPLPECYILIVKPSFKVRTGDVYKSLNKDIYFPLKNNKYLASGKVIKGLEKSSIEKVAHNLCNTMEPLVKSWFLQLEKIKVKISQNGALGTLMSGSGPSVYGLFKDKYKADLTGKLLRNWNQDLEVFVVRPRKGGVGKE